MSDTPELTSRFWENVVVDSSSGCWLWVGYKNRAGYGKFSPRKGRNVLAHRHAYFALVGPVVLELDHLCRVRHCINPEHLEPVTHAENVRRGDYRNRKRQPPRSRCIRGHEFAGENLLISSGKRYCRTCTRLRASRKSGS